MDVKKYLSRYHNMKLKLEKLEYLHEDYIYVYSWSAI